MAAAKQRRQEQNGAVAISTTQLPRGSSENNKKDGDNHRDRSHCCTEQAKGFRGVVVPRMHPNDEDGHSRRGGRNGRRELANDLPLGRCSETPLHGNGGGRAHDLLQLVTELNLNQKGDQVSMFHEAKAEL